MIAEIIERRGIKEVVHFSTTSGVVGVLASGYLKSRERVSDSERLEYVYKENSQVRRDLDWLDYVNLSITNINSEFFKISSGKWHKDTSWRILSFLPEVLLHDGVIFANTNNVYPCVRRLKGPQGLEAMFSNDVEWGYYGCIKTRGKRHAPSDTTDVQAEVLYPKQLSIDYLQRIYVSSEEDQDQVCGVLTALDKCSIDVVVAPNKFEGI